MQNLVQMRRDTFPSNYQAADESCEFRLGTTLVLRQYALENEEFRTAEQFLLLVLLA